MRPPSLAIVHMLLALGAGQRHGYAIKQDVERRTGGDIRLGPGTLYEAIQRLEEDGLIEEAPASADRSARRVYRLTRAGRAALRVELRRYDTVLAHARTIAPELIDRTSGGGA
jgi:DNA-binding PadR family transcriptional regulator